MGAEMMRAERVTARRREPKSKIQNSKFKCSSLSGSNILIYLYKHIFQKYFSAGMYWQVVDAQRGTERDTGKRGLLNCIDYSVFFWGGGRKRSSPAVFFYAFLPCVNAFPTKRLYSYSVRVIDQNTTRAIDLPST